MIIRNLENIGFDTLFKGFERAFVDYEIRFDKNEVHSMLIRRGFVPELSFAAFDDEEIVAFTLNGIGRFYDLPTAYDIATGTVKDYRGQGLAVEIFKYSQPFLKDAGIGQYVLEVLQNNHKAISVYRKLGFETTRQFDCFRQAISKVTAKNMDAENLACDIIPIDIESVASAQSYCDVLPSWQNSIDSINRGHTGLTMIGAFIDKTLVGHCVFDPETGDVAQLAVKREYRRRGIASRLLHEAIKSMAAGCIKVLNICSTDAALHAFLESQNITAASKQLEMTLKL